MGDRNSKSSVHNCFDIFPHFLILSCIQMVVLCYTDPLSIFHQRTSRLRKSFQGFCQQKCRFNVQVVMFAPRLTGSATLV